MDGPAPGPLSWRVSPGLVVAKLAGAVALSAVAIVAAVAGTDRIQVVVAGAAAVGVAAYALRDLIAPVRVAADATGVTVIAGYARRVRLPWAQIERVRVDARSRHGIRSEYLEIDTGDEIYLYSANELGAPVADVADQLDQARPPASLP